MPTPTDKELRDQSAANDKELQTRAQTGGIASPGDDKLEQASLEQMKMRGDTPGKPGPGRSDGPSPGHRSAGDLAAEKARLGQAPVDSHGSLIPQQVDEHGNRLNNPSGNPSNNPQVDEHGNQINPPHVRP